MYYPLSTIAVAANVEAYMTGAPMPYKVFTLVATFCMIGGTGSTLGLNFAMLRAKSERYKALGRVAIVPSLFNINEPLVFGVPMMYNPMMLIPSLLAPVVGTIVCVLFSGLIDLNPAVSVAWVVPYPIAGFLRGGIWFTVGVVIAAVLQGLLYLPFFKICDQNAYDEEQAELQAEAAAKGEN
jgi:PTS system cellobiose-specific IIC component